MTKQVPGAQDDGYSYLVQLLPYMKERILYDEIAEASGKFNNEAGPFGNSSDIQQPADSDGVHFFSRQIPQFRCPSYSGPNVCPDDAQYAGGAVSPAVGNYVAIVATDLEGADGKNPPWKKNYPSWENGAMVSTCWDGDCETVDGLMLKHIADGVSSQIILAESCEQRYASWFSSASTWVVATTGGTNTRESGGVVSDQGDGFIELVSGQLALDWGDPRAYQGDAARDVYLAPATNRWAGQHERVFGPSSEHHGDVILHAFADVHAMAISTDVDPHVYLWLITRADGDPGS